MLELISSLLMVAAITCTPNADGTWTCSGTGIEDIEGVEETEGGYICTNCVQMSSNDCVRLSQEILDQTNQAYMSLQGLYSKTSDLLSTLQATIQKYYDFVDSPYEYITGNSGWSIYYPEDYATKTSSREINNIYFLENILPAWHKTENYKICQLDPPIIAYGTIPTTVQISASHNTLVGIWKCSYTMAQQNASDLMTTYRQVEQLQTSITAIDNSVVTIREQAESITCSPCKLTTASGEGGGEGSGTGSETGCLECYLNALTQIKEVLERISSYLYSIEQEISKLRADMNDKLKSILDKMDDFSETVDRIDDYLTIDQSNMLSRITVNVEAFGEITNLFARYFRSFNATTDSDLKSTLDKVIGQNNEFDFEAYNETTNWFTRVEILLAMNAGLNVTNEVAQNGSIEEEMKDYDTALTEYEQNTEQSEAETSITDFIRTWDEIANAFRFWDNLEEPTEIWLMQSKTLDIGSKKGSLTVNVQAYESPVVRDVLRHIRVGFRILWYALGALVVFLIGAKLWRTVVDAIKWLIQLLATIFNS